MSDGQCVSGEYVCNKMEDCEDGSDEVSVHIGFDYLCGLCYDTSLYFLLLWMSVALLGEMQ